MIIYQNLAYCRYLFIWAFLFLSNIIPYSPMISLSSVIILDHLTNQNKESQMTKSKLNGLFLSEIILIYLCLLKKFSIDIVPNITFLIIYYLVLKFILKIDPVKLHKEYLPEDDLKFKDESYIQYFKRIWYYFIFFFKKHENASGTN